MSLFTKISKITSHFRKYNSEIFLHGQFQNGAVEVLHCKRVDTKKPTKIGIVLAKPDGPLSSVMPSWSIESANAAVKKAMLTASSVTAELR